MRHAEMGLRELRRAVDTMIVVPNERLLAVVGKDTTFKQALKKADEVLLHATQGISDLISVTGEVNVDFADVRTVMSNRGSSHNRIASIDSTLQRDVLQDNDD
jgi:cell division protein FtsZ